MLTTPPRNSPLWLRSYAAFAAFFRVARFDFTLEMLSIGDPTKNKNTKKHVLHVCSAVSQKTNSQKKRAEISKHVLAMNVGQDG